VTLIAPAWGMRIGRLKRGAKKTVRYVDRPAKARTKFRQIGSAYSA